MPVFEYALPAVRGSQAGRDFYVTMCPLELVPRLFPMVDTGADAKPSSQRPPNKARIPEIARYLSSHPASYVLSALTASMDGRARFEASSAASGAVAAGILYVPMSARFVVHDGLHRAAAVAVALRDRPELAGEAIPVVLFIDPGLKRAEQIFSDMKRNEARAARSLSILHDHGDEMARLVRALVSRVPTFVRHTELQRSKISNRSLKLFTLSGIYHGTTLLLAGREDEPYAARLASATDFWTAVGEEMPDWQRAVAGEVAPAMLRKNYIHAHALALAALGRVGRTLLEKHPKTWRKKLRRLKTIDWSRSNARLWEGRAMIAGRLSKATTCVVLTGNAIKRHLGLPLTVDETETDKRFRSRR